MKKLLLVRHAKSDWPENTEDFDRPLAEKGYSDAKKMSDYLFNNQVSIQKLVTSPAIRAFKTCEIFNETYKTEITTHEKLYNPSENNFFSVIQDFEDHVESVAIFSHNNGISNFANYIADVALHFPTCAVACFEADCTSWTDFEAANKNLIFFYEPKKIETY